MFFFFSHFVQVLKAKLSQRLEMQGMHYFKVMRGWKVSTPSVWELFSHY